MNTGEKIKKARLNKHISQKKLGELIGTSQQMIAQYETGSRKPKIETLTKIANALNAPLSDFEDPGTLSLADSILSLFMNNPPKEIQLSPEEEALKADISSAFYNLNISGKRKLADYAQDLTDLEKYKKKFKIQAVYKPSEADPDHKK